MTGTTWVEESRSLETPVIITNTHSVGVVRGAVLPCRHRRNRVYPGCSSAIFLLTPVVGETYDGVLNDINGFHVKPEHVFAALEGAASGPVAEGNVGGGTGMICHGFKGGIGTASREVVIDHTGYTVGV